MKKIQIVTLLTFATFLFLQCNSVYSTTNENLDKSRYDVVIDVGHGGKDPGAISTIQSVPEKEIVLQLGLKIKSELEKEGIKPLLTREDDSFRSLKEKINLIENFNARLTISLHMSISEDATKNGFITFFRDNDTASMKLDSIFHEELNKRNLFQDLGSQSGPFYLLTEASIPSILVELGYLSNPDDFSKIRKVANQDKIAAATTQAANRFLNQQ